MKGGEETLSGGKRKGKKVSKKTRKKAEAVMSENANMAQNGKIPGAGY